MGKHLGNALEPLALLEQHGADAVRWFMLAAGSPWTSRRVGHDAINDVVRKTLLTYWNTVSFFSLYAKASNFSLTNAPTASARPLMDRWILSELNVLIKEVDSAMEGFDSQKAGKVLSTFIDDLSNWYVRRSRRRFWDGDAAALATLHECCEKLTLLMAPLVPFITESVWQQLIRPSVKEVPISVHLADFPAVDESAIDEQLSSQVAQTRRIVELGRAARAESAVKIRQPLSQALIAASGWTQLPDEMKGQIAEELNVLSLQDISTAGEDLVHVKVKANFRSLGAKYGKSVQEIAQLISSADPAHLVSSIRANGTHQLESGTSSWRIDIDDLAITEEPKVGWTVATHDSESVALDLTLTTELVNAGNLREAIRYLQELRKSHGFEISDRIKVRWNASEEFVRAIESDPDHVRKEVLGTDLIRDENIMANQEGSWFLANLEIFKQD